MSKTHQGLVALAAVLAFEASAAAQLIGARNAPVAMGHHHLNVSNLEESRMFWELLGAERVELGDRHVMKLPNLLVFLRETAPTGGTIGTTVNHIGVQMPDVAAMVGKLKAAGIPIVTERELPDATGEVHYHAVQDTHLAFVMAPEGTKVELFENENLAHPVENHHIHFAAPDIPAMKAWYVEMFGAEPGQRGGMEAGQLPGVNLTFSPAAGEVVGTKGRALDHIGFEVNGLKALCEKLEKKGVKFDRAYTEIPELGVAVAFLTDPWGTYVELTEGLDAL